MLRTSHALSPPACPPVPPAENPQTFKTAILVDPDDTATAPRPTPFSATNPPAVDALAASGLPLAIIAAGVIGPANPAKYGPAAFFPAAGPGSWLARLPGASHSQFADGGAVINLAADAVCGRGRVSRKYVLSATATVMLAWLWQRFGRGRQGEEDRGSASALRSGSTDVGDAVVTVAEPAGSKSPSVGTALAAAAGVAAPALCPVEQARVAATAAGPTAEGAAVLPEPAAAAGSATGVGDNGAEASSTSAAPSPSASTSTELAAAASGAQDTSGISGSSSGVTDMADPASISGALDVSLALDLIPLFLDWVVQQEAAGRLDLSVKDGERIEPSGLWKKGGAASDAPWATPKGVGAVSALVAAPAAAARCSPSQIPLHPTRIALARPKGSTTS